MLFKFIYSQEFGLFIDFSNKLLGKEFYISKNHNIEDWFNIKFFREILGVNINLKQLKDNILEEYNTKLLTYIALAKKSGKLLQGKLIVERSLNNYTKPIIIQSTDSSKTEKFKKSEKYYIIEEYSSKQLSKCLGLQNVNYALAHGEFVNIILMLYKEKKIFKNLDINDWQYE